MCFYLASAMAGAHRLAMWRATLVIVSFMALSIVGWSYFGLKTGVAGMRVVRLFIT